MIFCCESGHARECRSCKVYRQQPAARELSDVLLGLAHAVQHDPYGAPGDTADALLEPMAKRAMETWRRLLGLPEAGQ